ncbi:MAG TPA: thioredoxin family protein [Candidatus Saccharimonas sp.]|jgi:thiol-disulfide isomerase/thioredoxin|nr:thioredoxin family protein [Candidatus Saccharimonas sp.]
MKSLYVIGIVTAIIAIGATVVLLQDKPAGAPQTTPLSTNVTPSSDSGVATATGRYVEYSERAVSTSGYTETILFFHAPWCPECRAYDTALSATPLPTGIQILKVDYDSAAALRKQYGVVIQTTFVKITSTGEKISVWPAYGKEKTLQAILDNT